MSGFSNPVTNAAGVLVRAAMKSVNYVANTSGWQITKNGFAEFNGALVRGALRALAASGAEIIIDASNVNPQIRFVSPDGSHDAVVAIISDGGTDRASLSLISGVYNPDGIPRRARLFMRQEVDETSLSVVDASDLTTTRGGDLFVASQAAGIGYTDPTKSYRIIVGSDGRCGVEGNLDVTGIRQKHYAELAGDQNFTNAVLTPVNNLSLPVDENSTYELFGWLVYTGQTFALGPGDLKLDWDIPFGATMQWARYGYISNSVNQIDTVMTNHSTTRALGTFGTGTNVSATPIGRLRTGGGGASAITLRAAQNSATATATTIRAGSWIKIVKVA